jgi:raffinose/stachyose/melibiose transport system substrate-binding protein
MSPNERCGLRHTGAPVPAAPRGLPDATRCLPFVATIPRSGRTPVTIRRKVRGGVAAVSTAVLATALAACGSSGPTAGGGGAAAGGGGGGGAGGSEVWTVSGGLNPVYEASVKRWNDSNPDHQVSLQLFQNDPYKQKLRVAMGAGNGPDLFFGWGGGILEEYVDAGNVEDLTPELEKDPEWGDKFFGNVLDTASFDGKTYGIPLNGMQPVVLYYNKDVFAEAGVEPPETYEDLLSLVRTFREQGITPISLGGASKWPNLMYEQYLVDRLGGPEVFQAVLDGKPDAWLDPTFIQANTKIQELVDAGAFPDNFSSIAYDTGQASALLYTGKAAMHLMGGWDFANMLASAPDFIKEGKLGWVPFPAVEGGKGDPTNIAGNPSNYYSLNADAKDREAALGYLKEEVMSDTYVDDLLAGGVVPPVNGLEDKLAKAENGEWLQFVYDTVKNAPHFQQSWDQALPPNQADALLTNLDRLFLKQITPQEFSDNMNAAAQK